MVTDTESDSGCKDCLKLKICQGDGCCLSPSLGDFALGTTRILSGSDLGECVTDAIKINTSLPIDVSFNHENTDGWKGKKAIIITGAVTYECFITEWIDDEIGDTSFATKCDVKFRCKFYIGSAIIAHIIPIFFNSIVGKKCIPGKIVHKFPKKEVLMLKKNTCQVRIMDLEPT